MSLLQVIENTRRRRRRRIFLSQNYSNSPFNSLLNYKNNSLTRKYKRKCKIKSPLMLGLSLVYIDDLRRCDASWQVAKISLDELAQVGNF